MSAFTKEYFIAKFQAIPEELWCVDHLDAGGGKHCVLGHCGASVSNSQTPEEMALQRLLRAHIGCGPVYINDAASSAYPQATPKQRILAALRDLP